MNGPDFLDTNILVYAYDSTNVRKQAIARKCLKQALDGGAIWSAQVLAEFSRVLLHKVTPAAKPAELNLILDNLAPVRIIQQDFELVRRGVEAHGAYGLRFWDGMIVAAAERGRCGRILSQDLNAGQKYLGVVVVNPF